MPMYASCCTDQDCSAHQQEIEWYASRMGAECPPCETCGQITALMVTGFAIPFAGDLDRFNDLGKERFNQPRQGGHWAWRKRSTRHIDGSPERVLIQTHADQRAYCKAEGLMLPDEISPGILVGDDGMTVTSQGQPGCWNWMPSELAPETPAPVTKPKPTFGGLW